MRRSCLACGRSGWDVFWWRGRGVAAGNVYKRRLKQWLGFRWPCCPCRPRDAASDCEVTVTTVREGGFV